MRIALIVVWVLMAGVFARAAEKPNVLFITVDDLNDWVGVLDGHPQVKTPNIDRLAQRGVLFSNAHCQAPICNPSRTSFMTGLRPSTTGIYANKPYFRTVAKFKEAVALPRYFSNHGYENLTTGKIFHGAYPDDQTFDVIGPRGGFGPLPKEKISWKENIPLWDWGVMYDDDEETNDYKNASWVIERLGDAREKPFFMSVGFYRPHVPLYATQKWFDLYPRESVVLPDVLKGDLDDVGAYSRGLNFSPIRPPQDWMEASGEWAHAVQAYLASVSYTDHQLGRVLDALDASVHADNTIIVLFSDHGFHLGEKKNWQKYTLWRRSTHVPLIVSVPKGMGGLRGRRCDEAVELLDMYPTLVELCGLPTKAGLDGQSLTGLLDDPSAVRDRPAVTTYWPNNHSVHGERYHYIRYADGSEELYDLEVDPNEWTNIAGRQDVEAIKTRLGTWMPATSAAPAEGSNYFETPDVVRKDFGWPKTGPNPRIPRKK